MKKITIRLLSILLAFTVVFTVVSGVDMLAFAANTSYTITNYNNSKKTLTIKTLMYVNEYPKGINKPTSMGGIGAEFDGTELYVLKGGGSSGNTPSNPEEKVAILYYYPDLTKSLTNSIKIIFSNRLLGHANAITIDENNLYVTCWSNYTKSNEAQTNFDNTKDKIMCISREVIRTIAKNISSNSYYKVTGNLQKYNNKIICKQLNTLKTNNKRYNKTITRIARWSYDKNTKTSTFIIGYSPGNDTSKKIIAFTKATYKNGDDSIIVSTSSDDIMYLENNCEGKVIDGLDDITYQDIGYKKNYGLFLPVYYKKSSQDSGTVNRILCFDIDNRGNKGKNSDNPLKPYYKIKLTRKKEGTKSLSQYEIESVGFIKRKINGSVCLRMILSCNKGTDSNSTLYDAVEISSDFEKFLDTP